MEMDPVEMTKVQCFDCNLAQVFVFKDGGEQFDYITQNDCPKCGSKSVHGTKMTEPEKTDYFNQVAGTAQEND